MARAGSGLQEQGQERGEWIALLWLQGAGSEVPTRPPEHKVSHILSRQLRSGRRRGQGSGPGLVTGQGRLLLFQPLGGGFGPNTNTWFFT